MRVENVRLGDLPDDICDKVLHSVRHYAVCFAHQHAEDQPPTQYGSGTLVKYKEHYAILTAAHVIRELRKLDSWDLVMLNHRGMRIQHSHVEYVQSPEASNPAEGPDIGFIRLAQYTAYNIASMFSFVELETHEKRNAPVERQPHDGIWVQVGYPAELGKRSRDEANRLLTTEVYCLAAVGGLDSDREHDEFDYYDGKVTYIDQYGFPKSFKGMSGAGMWFMRLIKVDGVYKIKDRFFSGVVFYEFASEGTVTAIRSHGRKSIYDYVCSRLSKA